MICVRRLYTGWWSPLILSPVLLGATVFALRLAHHAVASAPAKSVLSFRRLVEVDGLELKEWRDLARVRFAGAPLLGIKSYAAIDERYEQTWRLDHRERGELSSSIT